MRNISLNFLMKIPTDQQKGKIFQGVLERTDIYQSLNSILQNFLIDLFTKHMKESLESGLTDQSDNSSDNQEKQSQQFKALFLKNLRLQSKQIGTNICQILTPIICILFTFLMKTITETNMSSTNYELLSYPYKFSDYSYFDFVNQGYRKPLQWNMYQCVQECNATYLGINNGGQRTGLLGKVYKTMEEQVYFNPNPLNNQTIPVPMQVPFFLQRNETNLNVEIFNRLKQLGEADFNVITKKNGTHYLPDGGISFTSTSDQNLKFDLKINDVRDLDLHPVNGISAIAYKIYNINKRQYDKKREFICPTGSLGIFDTLSNAFLKQLTNKTIGSGYYYMPEDDSGVGFADTIISFVAELVFPIALSLLFPVFLYTVVLEKEERLIQMMKMNGMKISSYWAVFFCFNLMLAVITNVVFVFFGYFLTQMRFFTQTDPLLLIFTLLGWSLAQIGLAVFFQTFLSKSRSANIIGYLISIWLSMISSSLNLAAYQYPNPCPYWMRVFGPTAFVRIIYLMLSSCSQGKCYGNIGHIPTEMQQQLIYLYINFVFFFLLGAYLFEIIPQQFGVTRSPIFPFKMIGKLFKKCFGGQQQFTSEKPEEDPEVHQYIEKDEEDQFSKKQRHEVLTQANITKSYPLVINNIRKLYKKEGRQTPYPALRSFNLKVAQKETFGLLGPNGAGKSTLISILTGMFEPNFGNAWIGGYDIKNEVEKAQLQMGVCPQFDLLWPQLTVEQHLFFYARLKGIPNKHLHKKIQEAIKQVKLTKFRNFPSSSLSGGMKRRLSVAISLVGDPKIVFLDEPSTGLDPDNRRQLWQVLAKCQKKRSILITTHMMEEADTLCNRIGIITTGVLRTVGPQTTLKKKYGGGYRVTISTIKQERKLIDRNSLHLLQPGNRLEDYDENNDDMQNQDLRKSINSFIQLQQRQKQNKIDQNIAALNEFMSKNFINSYLMKQFNGCIMYRVPLNYKVSEIFEVMEKIEKQLSVMDVAVTNSSLEDVFMNVASKFEADQQDQQDQQVKQQRRKTQILENESDEFVSFPSQVPPQLAEKQQSVLSKKERQSIMSNQNQPVIVNKKLDEGYSSDDD